MSSIRSHPEWGIAALFAIVAALYSFSTPIFEASDEIFHYPVVQHIASTGTLPVQDPDVETLWEQEGSQPPLYYLIAASMTSWIDTTDLEEVRWINPHAKLGIPLDPDNKNMVIHRADERSQWTGTVLAVRLIRLLSIAFGTATVVLTYRLAKAVFPERKLVWLFATCLVALNPMFLFIAASVNNDNLAILLATWVLLLLVKVVKDGLTTARMITLATILALATLTKISGLTLIPMTGLALIYDGWKSHTWRRTALAIAVTAIVWAAIAGWWYVRNVRLYGELLGLDTMVAVAGPRDISLWALRHEWHGFWLSYWGLFGAVNILMPAGFYALFTGLTVVAVAGTGIYLFRCLRSNDLSLELSLAAAMLVQIGLVFAGVVRWTSTTFASQGRLMFPVISLMSILMAFGLLELIPKKQRQISVGLLGGTLLGLAILAPILAIRPAYTFEPSADSIPAEAVEIGYRYGPLELVATHIDQDTRRGGDRIPVTLYWRTAQAMNEDLSIFLHGTGRDYKQIGKIDSYPQRGLLATSLMEPHKLYADRYFLSVDEGAELPSIIRVEVGVGKSTHSSYELVNAIDAQGNPVSNPVLEAGIFYPNDAASCGSILPSTATLVGEIADTGQIWIRETEYQATPGDEVELTIFWDTWAASTDNLTTFVHLVGSDPAPLAQADGPPLNGDYPTSWWTIPCQVADSRTVTIPNDLPSGEYTVVIGLYNPNDPGLARMSILSPDGTSYPNDAAPAATITIDTP